MPTVKNTEENILQAAREVFMKKGFAAARMCDIAQAADINPALLHYYFRKKDKLFAVIFEQESKRFHANLLSILHSDQPFFDKIKQMVLADMEKLQSAPYLPMFILNEMHTNPERMAELLETVPSHAELYRVFSNLLREEYLAGRIRKTCPKQLFMSILGLTMFPFIAQPMLQHALGMDELAFNQLIQQRAAYISDMVIRSMQYETEEIPV